MKHGFTLVELSIVLVIIGLLISGVLVGQSLVGAAKIQAQIQQLTHYEIAINKFKDSFKSLPGDSELFSGNGNGLIQRQYGHVGCGYGNFYGEMRSFFQDLSAVGFSKKFDNSNDLDKGYPALEINDGIGMLASSERPGFAIYPNEVFLCLRVVNPGAMPDMNAADQDGDEVFPPDMALSLDLKMDDGLPYTGNFDVVNSTSSCRSNTEYLPENTNSTCRPTFAVNLHR